MTKSSLSMHGKDYGHSRKLACQNCLATFRVEWIAEPGISEETPVDCPICDSGVTTVWASSNVETCILNRA